jgi:hypothetical protein
VAEVRRLVFGALTPEQVEQLRRNTAAITSRIAAGDDRGDGAG